MSTLATTVDGLKFINPFVIGSGPPGTNVKVIKRAFKEAKDAHPEGILIASVMEEYNKDAWCEIIERCQDAGVDAFELNFSCPHGLPERKMGAAMGQDPVILEEVCG
jgi:dihydropyrimidine dehydrogenase (NADP+)/dihydropyrimidine dehydrogenase (NAD+) subunit PreA